MAGVQKSLVQTSQADWLREWHRYLVRTYCGECLDSLEVGCGEGRVMQNISDMVSVRGIDIDADQVTEAGEKGLDVLQMDGLSTSFERDSFDLVFCSFYLMWVADIGSAVREMIRIARRKVLMMSEPVWTGSVVAPPDLSRIVEAEIDVIEREGGDPDSGLMVVDALKDLGRDFRFGSVPNDTSPVETEKNVNVELRYLDDKGIHLEVDRIDMFHVPFVWAAVDL